MIEQSLDEHQGFWSRVLMGPAALLAFAILAMSIGWTPWGGFYRNVESAGFARMAGAAIVQGDIPLWNGAVFPGGPILGNEQVGALYPLHLVHGLFPLRVRNVELSPAWGFYLAGIAELFIAGFGAWLLAKRHSLSAAASLLASVVFMFSGSQWIFLNHPYGHAACWVPLGLAMAAGLKSGGLWTSIGLGLTTALAVSAGRADAALAFVLLTALMLVLCRPTFPAIFRWILAMALGLLLSGAQWVTFVEYARDWGVDAFRDGRSGERFHSFEVLLGMVLPLGEQSRGFAGYAGLILAAAGLFSGRGCVKWVSLGVLAGGISVSGVCEWLARTRLGFSWDFSPVLLAGTSAAVAILAGMGLDCLKNAPAARESDRYMAPVMCAVVFFLMVLILNGGYAWNRMRMTGKLELAELKGVWLILGLHAAAAGVAWGCVRVRPAWSWWVLIVLIEGAGALGLSGLLNRNPLETQPSDALVMNRVMRVYQQQGRTLEEGLDPESTAGKQIGKIEVIPRRTLVNDFAEALEGMKSWKPETGKMLWVERPDSLPMPERELFERTNGAWELPKYVRVRNSETEGRTIAVGAPVVSIAGEGRAKGSFGVALRGGGSGQWVLVDEAFSPGWKATEIYSSGRAFELLIYPGNGIFQAIPLDDRTNGTTGGGEKAEKQLAEIRAAGGQFGVWLEFSPRGWRHGWMTSLAGGVLLLTLITGRLSGVGGTGEQSGK